MPFGEYAGCLGRFRRIIQLALAIDLTAVLLTTFLLPPSASLADAPWTGTSKINDDRAIAAFPDADLAEDGSGNAYAIWTDWRLGDNDIFFTRWDQLSGRWSANQRVTDSHGWVFRGAPIIAVDISGNAFAVWRDKGSGAPDLYSLRSAWRSASTGLWNTNTQANDRGMETRSSGTYSVAVDGQGRAYLAWVGRTTGGGTLYLNFSQWDSTAGRWMASETIATATDSIGGTSMSADAQGNVFLAWGECCDSFTINLSRRDASSGQWVLYQLAANGFGGDAQIGLDSEGNVYLHWTTVTDPRLFTSARYLVRWDASVAAFGSVETLDGVFRATGRRSLQVAADGSVSLLVGKWDSSSQVLFQRYLATRSSGGSWTMASLNGLVSDYEESPWPVLVGNQAGDQDLLWESRRSGNLELYWSRQPGGTSQWGATLKVNDSLGKGNASHGFVDIVADGAGNVYAIWPDGRLGRRSDNIYFSYRPVAGQWGTNERVDDDTGPASKLGGSLAVDSSGNVYAVWTDSRAGSERVYFSYRLASSGTWSPNEPVDTGLNAVYTFSPSVVVDTQGRIYVTWEAQVAGGSGVYFSQRRAVTGTWDAPARVNGDPSLRLVDGPPVAAADASGNLYVAWSEYTSSSAIGEIYFASRDNASGQWSTTSIISQSKHVYTNDLAVDSQGNVYVAWTNPNTSYLRRWDRYSGHWDPVETLPFHQVLAIASDAHGRLYALWQDLRGQPTHAADIFFEYRYSAPAGWSYPIRVNESNQPVYNPAADLALDSSGNAYAVWGGTNFSSLSASDLPPRYRTFMPNVMHKDLPGW